MTRISLPVDDYPSDLKKALSSLETRRGRHGGLSPDAIRKITDPLGQLLFIAQRDGQEVKFNIETIGAYIRELDRRTVKNTSKQTYMKGLWRLAVALDWPDSDVAKIQAEVAFYRSASAAEVPEKERKLLENPLVLEDLAKAARHWFEVARDTKNVMRRRSNFQRAAFLALTSLVPSRVGDVRHLRIDVDITRNRENWALSTASRKTSYEYFPKLHDNLTPYLDALVHLGERQRFEKFLSMKSGKPLFSKEDGTMVLRETLWRHFRIATGGHSPHIVRTLTHDFLAADDDPEAAKIARALCGHTSLNIGSAYEVHARRARFLRAQQALAKSQKRAIASPPVKSFADP